VEAPVLATVERLVEAAVAAVDQVVAFLDGGYQVALLPAADDPGMRRFVTALAASGRTVADLA